MFASSLSYYVFTFDPRYILSLPKNKFYNVKIQKNNSSVQLHILCAHVKFCEKSTFFMACAKINKNA
jgi:hypothetical protein